MTAEDPTGSKGTEDLAKTLQDVAHIVVGLGVVGWNRAQVRRRELLKELGNHSPQIEATLDEAKGMLASAIRTLDERMEPVRADIDTRLDKAAEHLPEQARTVVDTARRVARETEKQVRQALGAT